MPPDGHRSEGTPSFSEVPYAWGEPFFAYFFLAFEKKVSRRKGETLSGRYRSNGYVHLQRMGRLSGRYRWQASSHRDRGTSAKNGSAARPPSLASQLPQGSGYIRKSQVSCQAAIASRLPPTGDRGQTRSQVGPKAASAHSSSPSGVTRFCDKYRSSVSFCGGTELSPTTCHILRSIPCASKCPTAASIADNTHNCAGSFVV